MKKLVLSSTIGSMQMKLVKKVWGTELWIANREYCGKILNLKKGFRCSIHKHKIKDETFYLMEGKVLMELGKKTWKMVPGDSIHVPRNKYHRFSGLEKSKIIEFSTKHSESDSYRKTESGQFDLQELQKEIENNQKIVQEADKNGFR